MATRDESWHVLRGYELRVSRPHKRLIHKAAPCRHGAGVVVERVRCRAKNPVRCLQRPEHFQPAAAFDLGELHALSPNKLFVEANWGRGSTEKGDTLRDRKRVPMVLHVVLHLCRAKEDAVLVVQQLRARESIPRVVHERHCSLTRVRAKLERYHLFPRGLVVLVHAHEGGHLLSAVFTSIPAFIAAAVAASRATASTESSESRKKTYSPSSRGMTRLRKKPAGAVYSSWTSYIRGLVADRRLKMPPEPSVDAPLTKNVS
eukprot:scaffold22445_cov73-Phaeocystis_antarctica.AAC.5